MDVSALLSKNLPLLAKHVLDSKTMTGERTFHVPVHDSSDTGTLSIFGGVTLLGLCQIDTSQYSTKKKWRKVLESVHLPTEYGHFFTPWGKKNEKVVLFFSFTIGGSPEKFSKALQDTKTSAAFNYVVGRMGWTGLQKGNSEGVATGSGTSATRILRKRPAVDNSETTPAKVLAVPPVPPTLRKDVEEVISKYQGSTGASDSAQRRKKILVIPLLEKLCLRDNGEVDNERLATLADDIYAEVVGSHPGPTDDDEKMLRGLQKFLELNTQRGRGSVTAMANEANRVCATVLALSVEEPESSWVLVRSEEAKDDDEEEDGEEEDGEEEDRVALLFSDEQREEIVALCQRNGLTPQHIDAGITNAEDMFNATTARGYKDLHTKILTERDRVVNHLRDAFRAFLHDDLYFSVDNNLPKKKGYDDEVHQGRSRENKTKKEIADYFLKSSHYRICCRDHPSVKKIAFDRHYVSRWWCACIQYPIANECVDPFVANPIHCLLALKLIWKSFKESGNNNTMGAVTREVSGDRGLLGDWETFIKIIIDEHSFSEATMCAKVEYSGADAPADAGGEPLRMQRSECAYGTCKDCGVKKLIDQFFTKGMIKRIKQHNNKLGNGELFYYTRWQEVEYEDKSGRKKSKMQEVAHADTLEVRFRRGVNEVSTEWSENYLTSASNY